MVLSSSPHTDPQFRWAKSNSGQGDEVRGVLQSLQDFDNGFPIEEVICFPKVRLEEVRVEHAVYTVEKGITNVNDC